jgi:hypothetical protein
MPSPSITLPIPLIPPSRWKSAHRPLWRAAGSIGQARTVAAAPGPPTRSLPALSRRASRVMPAGHRRFRRPSLPWSAKKWADNWGYGRRREPGAARARAGTSRVTTAGRGRTTPGGFAFRAAPSGSPSGRSPALMLWRRSLPWRQADYHRLNRLYRRGSHNPRVRLGPGSPTLRMTTPRRHAGEPQGDRARCVRDRRGEDNMASLPARRR